MSARILITGGAGFIGSHLADALLAQGHAVRVLDSLSPQVHGAAGGAPDYLAPEVDFHNGDVRDPAAVKRALEGIDVVFHLAAMVGVGQSMYQIDDYTAVNDLGTATLLQHLIERPVGRLVVASSMSIYGEGLYAAPDGTLVHEATRSAAQLRAGQWEPLGPDAAPLTPVATPESKRPELASVYALGKYAQERMCLIAGQAYGIPTTALRFFNVYGTRQALSNPYTGVLAIFAARLLNGAAPRVFEDGEQKRDFVHVSDVARACIAAMERDEAAGHAINVGSGAVQTVRGIGAALARTMGRNIAPEVTGEFRAGDIRHCFADLTLARRLLGFEPRVAFDDGLAELVDWVVSQTAEDRIAQADRELRRRGLVA